MDTICRFLWTLFSQIVATLGCLVMLVVMLSLPSAMVGFAFSYPDPDWHQLFSNFTTIPLILYTSFRIGFYYGVGIASCLAIFWGVARLGMLDMIAHLFSPMSSDYVAGDLPPWDFRLASLLLVKLAIAVTAIVYLGKKSLYEVRNRNLPIS
jgi:hypothetical protein